jgi:hypothetical protein
VADCGVAGHGCYFFCVKYVHEETRVFAAGDYARIIYRYAAGFLTSVLECEKSGKSSRGGRDAAPIATGYAENSAFFV